MTMLLELIMMEILTVILGLVVPVRMEVISWSLFCFVSILIYDHFFSSLVCIYTFMAVPYGG
jgi:hypothetical protein